MDPLAQGHRGNRVPWRRHRRVALPGVGQRIVAFQLAVHPRFQGLAALDDAALAVADSRQPG
jgi:hypothetical protein